MTVYCEDGHALDYPNQLCNICMKPMKKKPCIEYYNGRCNSLNHTCEDCPDRKIKSNFNPDGTPRMKKPLSFEDLRFANVQRNKEWDAGSQITGAFRGLELAGEVGELCNKVKKLERERLGLKGSRTTLMEVAMEMADCAICLDLLAMHYSISLDEIIKLAFDLKSAEHGFKTRLG